MKPASIAPLYCALYPAVAEICRKHGYALAIHGSMGRDFDLICVPWSEQVSAPEAVLKDITTEFAVGKPLTKNHGRLSYAVSISFGECFFDMSFLPSSPDPRVAELEAQLAAERERNKVLRETLGTIHTEATESVGCISDREILGNVSRRAHTALAAVRGEEG